jgi:2-dehydro-3-deoxy-D-arabinonate dehydratase
MTTLKLHLTDGGPVAEDGGRFYAIADEAWDDLVRRDDLLAHLRRRIGDGDFRPAEPPRRPRAPIGSQEVWAAGVTYLRSKVARMEESAAAGGGDFYDRVYVADRPELFFKATPHRVVGPGSPVRIRRDSKWNVPEPELALLVNSDGRVLGYTVGNDMSSRDIEGENPLYLPQAKVYDGSCALGPCVLLTDGPLPRSTEIRIEVRRAGAAAFAGATSLAQMKRGPAELVEWLFRDNSFPNGCFLLTGTGVVPPDSFTLQPGDEVAITIEPIGTLSNVVGGER